MDVDSFNDSGQEIHFFCEKENEPHLDLFDLSKRFGMVSFTGKKTSFLYPEGKIIRRYIKDGKQCQHIFIDFSNFGRFVAKFKSNIGDEAVDKLIDKVCNLTPKGLSVKNFIKNSNIIKGSINRDEQKESLYSLYKTQRLLGFNGNIKFLELLYKQNILCRNGKAGSAGLKKGYIKIINGKIKVTNKGLNYIRKKKEEEVILRRLIMKKLSKEDIANQINSIKPIQSDFFDKLERQQVIEPKEGFLKGFIKRIFNEVTV